MTARSPRLLAPVALVLTGLAIVAACSGTPGAFEVELKPLPADVDDYAPLAGYGEMDVPADNPLTPEKAALGRQLYYDSRLSGDGSRSCYACHVCESGLTDGRAQAVGAYDKQLTRSSPTMWNVGFYSFLYWDGRADSLEKQAFAAWKGGNMGAGDRIPEIVDEINGIEAYRAQFQSVFGEDATADNIPQALAAYMRTIVGGDTPWDRWQAGDESAVSDAAKRGWEVFQAANCTQCHAGVLFTDQVFHNVGIGYVDGEMQDIGRYKVSENERDMGAFKTPTLRDIADSAPYFHDGSVATLEEAIDLMLGGGIDNPWLDRANLQPADVSEQERADLIEFLKALDEPCEFTAPRLP